MVFVLNQQKELFLKRLNAKLAPLKSGGYEKPCHPGIPLQDVRECRSHAGSEPALSSSEIQMSGDGKRRIHPCAALALSIASFKGSIALYPPLWLSVFQKSVNWF
jgi:hypothetical protein